jgi:hypothetical protein
MSAYYIGQESSLTEILGADNPRYFYALRRDDEGLVYFAKIDQITSDGTITINQSGLAENDFSDFEYGVDFFDGRLAEDHSRPYGNLVWDQYRWDSKNVYYYINEAGELIVRINQTYVYPPELIVTP